ncbi:TPA: ead/Ea22-like family protein [Klebsiella oxytoca]
MTTDITKLAPAMKAAAEKATPGEWRYLKTTPFMDAEISAANNTRVVNLLAGDVTEANSAFIALANPANVLALVEALEKAQSELAKANGVLDKIKSTSCHVDTSDGSFIPNSLDAWGRPVPQYLPYDFSGNPGASATQYCNGWNDAGGYWLNYVRELESRTVTVKMPQRLQPGADGWDDWYVHSDDEGEYLKVDDVLAMLTAAGIKWEAE